MGVFASKYQGKSSHHENNYTKVAIAESSLYLIIFSVFLYYFNELKLKLIFNPELSESKFFAYALTIFYGMIIGCL